MGYIGQSRSERSQEAIDAGLKTFTQLQAWQKRAVKAGAVLACEWHHTGKFYNKTNYYDPEDFQTLKKEDFPPNKKEEEKVQVWFVLVSANWGGTKRYPKITGMNAEVRNKLTAAQIGAKKYTYYGGFIKEFTSEANAVE